MHRRNEFGAAMRRWAKCAMRFVSLTCIMGAGIALLALIQGVVLWRSGVDYLPQASVRSAGVAQFSLHGDSGWASSHIYYRRQSSSEGLQREILLHDLRRGGPPLRQVASDFQPRRLAASPDSRRLAILCDDGSIYFGCGAAPARPLQRLTTAPEKGVDLLACSPDGRMLAAADRRRLYLWRLPAGELLRELQHDGGEPRGLSFSGDSLRLLTMGRRGQLHVWEVPEGQRLRTLILEETALRAELSDDGRWIACTTARARACVIEVDSGRELWKAPIQFAPDPPSIAISRDASQIATAERRGEGGYVVRHWDARTGEPLRELAWHPDRVTGLAFAADGTLYSWDRGGMICGWHPATGRKIWSFDALQWVSAERAS